MKHKKFSVRAAQNAFAGFRIRKICTYLTHAPIEETKYHKMVVLKTNFPRTEFVYKSVEYIRLNDYQKDLYDFIMSLPKTDVWYETEKSWDGTRYQERFVKIHIERD